MLGASFAFGSGSLSALMHDTLTHLGRKKEYLKFNKNISTIFLLTTMVTALAGPYLFSINKFIPIALTCFFALGSTFVGLLFFEKLPKKNSSGFLKEHYLQIERGLKYSFNLKRVLWLILFTSLIGFVASAIGKFLEVPYILNLGFVIKQVAIIEFISLIIQTLIVYNSEKLEKKFGENICLILVFLIPASALLISLFVKSYLIGILFGLLWGATTFSEVLTDNYVIHITKKRDRATVLSVRSMIAALVSMIGIFFMGFFTDSFSIKYSIIFISIIAIFFGVILMGYKLTKKY